MYVQIKKIERFFSMTDKMEKIDSKARHLPPQVGPCTWSSYPTLCKRKLVKGNAFWPFESTNLFEKGLSDATIEKLKVEKLKLDPP